MPALDAAGPRTRVPNRSTCLPYAERSATAGASSAAPAATAAAIDRTITGHARAIAPCLRIDLWVPAMVVQLGAPLTLAADNVPPASTISFCGMDRQGEELTGSGAIPISNRPDGGQTSSEGGPRVIRMMIRWRARRSVRRAYTAAALLSCGASVVLAQGLAPGQWELNVAGSMYSLRANEADLSDVVSAIDAMTPADVRLRSLPDRHVSGTFHDLGLDDLLDRMDVDYVLFYDRGDAPDRAVLRRALIGLEDVPGISVTQLQGSGN